MNSNEKIQTYTLGKLQMYDECPQRYKLCYIDKVHIVENIGNIKSSQKGNNIHNIINFYLKGEDVSKLVSALSSSEKTLWHNFKNSDISSMNYFASEYAFNLRLDEYWLTGRIDALFENGGNYVILDWKTGEKFNPENVKFQTTFYLFCMYEILKFKGYVKETKQLSLYYMDLANDSVIKIHFDDDLYIKYKNQILDIINKINNNNNFFCNKTDRCKNCKYYRACPYW